jgi:hypothetical protein
VGISYKKIPQQSEQILEKYRKTVTGDKTNQNAMSPWREVLLEKLKASQILEKILAFRRTRISITVHIEETEETASRHNLSVSQNSDHP